MRTARTTWLAVWLLSACGMAHAAAPLPEFEVADRLVPTDPQPERELLQGVGAGVTVVDVTYATYPGFRPLHLDLYRVQGDPVVRPLVLYLHGGGWQVGNPRVGGAIVDMPKVLAQLARRGYVVASMQYRLSGEASHPAQLQDLQSALAFLRTNAARLGIDASKIALWGMSAGAHVAGLGAVSCGESQPAPAAAQRAASACVQAFVGWFGTYDLVQYAANPRTRDFLGPLLGCGDRPCPSAVLAGASPISFVDGRDPPALLVHGSADRNSPATQSSSFAERLRAAGVPTELLLLPDASHGLIGPSLAATHATTSLALAATFDFLDRRLSPAGER